MLVVSALRIDPRVERAARALAARGWRVRIVAPDISDPLFSERSDRLGPKIPFHLLPFIQPNTSWRRRGSPATPCARQQLAFRPFAYHCHDLNTALIGMRAASEIGARCVCDFHEWSSENVSWSSERPFGNRTNRRSACFGHGDPDVQPAAAVRGEPVRGQGVDEGGAARAV